MQLKLLGKRFRFVTNWKMVIFYVLFMPLFLGLGYWQLGRATQKVEQERLYEQRLRSAPIALAQALDQPDFQKVEIAGRFEPDYHFLLDNRTHQGAAGYEVISVFDLNHTVYLDNDAGASAIDYVWVNRGWIAAGATREQLPRIVTPDGEVRLQAIIDANPDGGFVLKDLPYSRQWPQVIQRIDLTRMEQHLNQAMGNVTTLPYLLRTLPDSIGGFQSIWNPVVMRSEKHLGYALQWFSMGAALTILYLFVSIKRVKD